MAGCRALSRSLQLLLRSPAALQHSRAAAASALQCWVVQPQSSCGHHRRAAGSLRGFASGPSDGEGEPGLGPSCCAQPGGMQAHPMPCTILTRLWAADEESKDGEDLSFTTAGDVAEGWLPEEGGKPDAGSPQPEPDGELRQEQPPPPQTEAQALEADLDSHDRDMELLRAGNPEEVLLRMVQRMGGHLPERSFEEAVTQVGCTQVAERSAGTHRGDMLPGGCRWATSTVLLASVLCAVLAASASQPQTSCSGGADGSAQAAWQTARSCQGWNLQLPGGELSRLWAMQASERDTRRAERRAKELALQEQYQRARVPLVDSLGRAYGTGKRKCSVARVWIRWASGPDSQRYAALVAPCRCELWVPGGPRAGAAADAGGCTQARERRHDDQRAAAHALLWHHAAQAGRAGAHVCHLHAGPVGHHRYRQGRRHHRPGAGGQPAPSPCAHALAASGEPLVLRAAAGTEQVRPAGPMARPITA